MSRGKLSAAFLVGGRGRIFAVLRKPALAVRGGLLIVPPFAEEMNKSRHLFTEVANQLAALGIATVIVDLFGTGESEGEFADADWDVWKADLAATVTWCSAQGIRITDLLGVRLGCALGCETAREHGWRLERTVLWQPVLSGARALDQFLRLRVAATMMQKNGKDTIAGLRARLKNGETVEVAGYEVAGRLAEQLDRVHLPTVMSANLGAVQWIEVVRSADAAPPTPSLNAIEQARANGVTVGLQALEGEPFWSSVEIVRNPALVAETARTLGAQP
ncbi:MAG: hydrolase 2, exosortase A system-associated [Steroidobacter sp.]